MMADLPHTLYRKRKGKQAEEEELEAIRLTREAAERRARAAESGEYIIEDVFNGIADE